LDLILRKIAHAAEFGILTFWFFQALSQSVKQSRSVEIKIALIWALIFAFGYAISDEIHQGFVFGRVSSILDVGIDSIGIILMGWYLNRKESKLFSSYPG
jgi:VanZ family protein